MPAKPLSIELHDAPSGPRVRLSLEGHEPVEQAFTLGSASLTTTPLKAIEAGRATLDDLCEIGTQLWSAIFGDAGGALLDAARADAATEPVRLVLEVDPRHARLPWESLYDLEGAGFLLKDERASLERVTRAPRAPKDAPQPLASARVLVVIPAGSGLNVESEWHGIRFAIEELGGAVTLERLDGPVTADTLDAALRAKRYDVVHFIGHGNLDEDGHAEVRLNAEGAGAKDAWLPAEAFAALFAGQRGALVVLNCCFGAYPPESRVLSGLGPFLLREGVRAVVAMRFEIADRHAVRFSRELYRALFTGERAGRIDTAVARGRRALFLNQGADVRAFVTPVLFLAGSPQLFALEEVKAPSPVAAPRVSAPVPRIALPKKLVAAVREGRCVPVVGPALARAPSLRGQAPPDARKLARLLASACDYPEMRELELAERTSGFLDELVLQRVCQHFAVANDRWQLVEEIRASFRLAEVPEPLRALARWPVPGVIYTAPDGLLEAAFSEARRAFATLVGVDDTAAGTGPAVPLLVHLRGSPGDHKSLVLTVDDHDELAERVFHTSDDVAGLVASHPGRALLLLGASPSDGALKQLCLQLAPPSVRDNMAGVFIARESPSPVDEARWQRFRPTFIDAEPSLVVAALSAELEAGARA